MNKYEQLINKILESNFADSFIKVTYLYNELFISVWNIKEFGLFWLFYKTENLVINNYKWDNTKIWKIFKVIFKKYENIFENYLKSKQLNLFNIWEESEFINIYDKKELTYDDIKNKLDFTFLDDYSYRRRSEMSFKLEEKSILYIYHSDFECSKCSWPKESFVNFIGNTFNNLYDEEYFWINDKKFDYTTLNTNITEYESIVMWWNDKINEILSDKNLLLEYDIVSINKTCISVIMWDDIESVLSYNNISKEKTIYVDQNMDSWYKAIINFLKNLDINQIQTKKEKIVFFWLNKNKNTYELIQFLQNNFWIEVWNVLLPNIDKKDLESIMSYKFAVFFSWREINAQNIFKLYPIENFESNIPYWITKTYNLCKNILQNYSINDSTKLNNIFEEYSKENINLYEKVIKYDIWFIIHDFHIPKFLSDNFRWTTIISMLNDMWFHLKFFIYPTKEIYKKYIDEFNSKNDLDYKNNFNIIVSNKKEDLDNFISNKKIQLYYSEIANDNRILSKNKEQFSIWDLEYGIEWFYRSFDLLIKKCEKVDYLNNLL